MAKKQPKSKPDGDKAQKSTEQQKPAPVRFPESEWAFHKVPKEDLRYCALWELRRLRENNEKPWLDLTTEARQQFVVQADGSGLQQIPTNACDAVSAAIHRYPHLMERGDSALKVVPFLVDFEARAGTLRQLFRLWLKNSPHHKRWQGKSKPPTDRWKSILRTCA